MINTREGNGTPLQSSCLENLMEGGAWKASVHGVAEGWTRLRDFTFTHWRRQWQPTPVFLPGESQVRGSLVGCRLWDRTESDTTEATQQQQQKRVASIFFTRQRGPQWANALKTVCPTLEGVVRSFIVFREQDVVNSWPVLGLAGIKVKFQASSTLWFQSVYVLVVSSFHLVGGEGVCFL